MNETVASGQSRAVL